MAANDLGAETVLGGPIVEAFRAMAADKKYQGRDSKVIYKWLGDEDPVLS